MMTPETPFKFDFNEDADPVDELHRRRLAVGEHFKTLEAVVEYHRSTPSVKEMLAELDEEIAQKEREPSVGSA